MRSINTLLVLSSLLPLSLLSAQNPTSNQPPVPTSVTSGDAILATWLHSACTNEIALAGIAVKQAKSPEVRAFAQKMVDDHTAFAAKLQPFAAASSPTTAKVGAMPKPVPIHGKIPADASSTRPQVADGTFDHAGLIRELSAKCLASDSKLLGSKPAAEFDRFFLAMQVGAHTKGIDMLTVFRAHASPTFVATIDEGLKVLTAHHEQVLALQQKLGNVIAEGHGGR